jgi:uncharacterized membrane protein YjgN (DUF898 family)
LLLDKLLKSAGATPAIAVLIGAVIGLIVWLVVWPVFAVRMQRIVWSHTRWGSVYFHGEMRWGTLLRLVLKQTLGVVVTLGLYWPFAAVAVARYRITSVALEMSDPIAAGIVQAPAAGSAGASGAPGDAAADFFGLDLGW